MGGRGDYSGNKKLKRSKSNSSGGSTARGHLPSENGYQKNIETLKSEMGVSDERFDEMMGYVEEYIAGDFKMLHQYQTGKLGDSAMMKKYSDNLEEFISKAPNWNGGTIYRGVSLSDAELNGILSGRTFDMGGTKSWSSDDSVAWEFADSNAFGSKTNKVIFRASGTKKGTSLAFMDDPYYPSYEVLVSKDAKYIPIQSSYDGHAYIIDVAEI